MYVCTLKKSFFILWVTTQTQLFLTQKSFFFLCHVLTSDVSRHVLTSDVSRQGSDL